MDIRVIVYITLNDAHLVIIVVQLSFTGQWDQCKILYYNIKYTWGLLNG